MAFQDPIIQSFTVRDLRWPTSLQGIGSDAINLAGEDALAYLQLHCDNGMIGTGWSYSNGHGNEYVD
jgi:L-galactonate dehydratase